MSYEKAKAVTINLKKKTIFITSRCSNVWPATYERWQYKANDDKVEGLTEEQSFLLPLVLNIINGDIHLNSTVNTNVRYAAQKTMIKVSEIAKQRGYSHFWDMVDYNEHQNQYPDDVVAEMMNTFTDAYHEKVDKTPNVITNDRFFLKKKTTCRIFYTYFTDDAKVIDNHKELWLELLGLPDTFKAVPL